MLKNGNTFLDVACGRGQYAITAAEIIGNRGLIYAIDLWEDGIATLLKQASVKGIKNMKASVNDVSKRLPIENNRVDVCLMATVLHDLVEEKVAAGTLSEIARVLNPQGALAIIGFKKIPRDRPSP